MKTLVVVITHPEAQSQVDHNYPWWFFLRADITGVEHEGKPPMQWPAGIPVVQIGTDPDHEPNSYMGRMLRIMEYVLSTGHDFYCFIEADVMFFREIPLLDLSNTPIGTLAGYRNQGFHGDCFWHCPWLFRRDKLELAIKFTKRLFHAGITEKGTIDRFFGLMGDLYPEVAFKPSRNYSRNTIYASDLADARSRIVHPDCWAAHGVKTKEICRALSKS